VHCLAALKTGRERSSQLTIINPVGLCGWLLAGVAELILKHHERWDGSGYPLGLKGENIPIECRILAVIDAYDAMISKRSYNKVKTAQAAADEIKLCSGSQFDPALVEFFLEVVGYPK
jgi:HD-GYP domain-containing protein (c-di-GMP phosphodiesterase class II)